MKINACQPGKLSIVAVITALLCLCLGTLVFVVAADFLLGTEVLVPRSAWPASTDEYLELARSRVQIGDERAKAVQALSDAWYHGVCDHSSGGIRPFIDDVFLYGPHDRDRATVIIIRSEPREGRMTIFDIGIIESDLFLIYSKCLPPEFITATPAP